MSRRIRDLAERLDRIERALDAMSRSMDKIEVATIVRDPSSKLASDAYDGLRKQVIAGANERVAHLYQIARFTDATSGIPELAGLIREWAQQAELVRLDNYDDRYFDVLGGDGDGIRCLRPAYVDGKTGRPIVMGQAERVPQDRQEPHRSLDTVQQRDTGNNGHQQEVAG